ncbi:MAG: thioredoxin family protein [Gammaproteobacteria bacterium]|nr:thioredoxin family protein [Gammaproteobacteria bacterium]MDH5659369.1 thioredoxin family protein [Gammaproteobacteria bacterium]
MKAILILAGPYSSCKATQIVWEKLCGDKGIKIEVFNLKNKNGQEIAANLNIKSFPALIIDNKVVAVGHPNEKSAEKVIQSLGLD